MAFAESKPSEPSKVLLFSPAMGNYGGATLEREISLFETIPLAGEYRLKARIALQQEPVQKVLDSVELKWAHPLVISDGWQENNGRWNSTAGTQKNAIYFSIAPPSQSVEQRVPALGDFDELWFDYRDRGGGDNCEVSFIADALAETAQKSTASLKLKGDDGLAKLSPALRVQAASVAWLPKDNLYLTKRVLGMEFDEAWRYTQDGKNTVVQRRFHVSLDGMEALDFQFLPGTQIKGINLHVAHGNRRTSDTVIPWDAIPHQIESTAGGLMRVRLLIGEWLKQNGNANGDSQKIFLMETVAFLAGEAGEIAQARPLKEVVFLADETNGARQPSAKYTHISLPMRAESLAPGHKRWIIDLRQLSRSKWFDVRLGRASLAIRQRDPALQCALQPLGLRLASLANGKEPRHIAEMRRWSSLFGGPFDAADPLKKEVEWVEAGAYVPLSLLPDRGSPEPNKINFPEWGLHFLTTRGWNIFHSPDGFTFNGQGGWIDTTWELPDVLTQASSRLFLRLPQGSEHVRSGRAQIDFSGGSGTTINFLPNRPIPLGSAVSGKRVARITLHLEMDNRPATLKMQELALFHPFLISQEEAFSARRPFWEFLPLRAEENGEQANGKPFLDEFVVHGAAESGKALPKVWRTSVATLSKNLTAVKVDYALSELPHNACWLTLRARTEHKQTSLTLCPAGTKGELIQPLAQAVKELGAEEVVLAFEWEANPHHATAPLTFEIKTQLGYSSQPSVRELLMRNSVKLGGQNHFPVAAANADDFFKGGKGWLDFGQIKLESQQKLNIEAPPSPYFKVQKFTFENGRPLTAKDMSQLFPSENRPSAWPARLTKLALLAALGGAAWLLWRRGVLQTLGEALWSGMVGLTIGLSTLSGRLLLWVTAAVYARRRSINRAALLAAFPSAWLLAKLWGDIYLDGFLGFAAMFSLAAIWHEMRWGSREMTLANSIRPDGVTPREFLIFLLVTCISLGWAAWAQGKGLSLFTVLAPLAGVPYFCLAWWKRILAGARSQAGAFLMLFGVAVLLYALGLLQRYGQGENYFFTIGGIVAVFSWRAFMRYAREPIFCSRPSWAKIIYGGRGSIYFFGALIFLVITAGILMFNLAPVAEQVAVVVYYFLVAGTILEILALRRDARKDDKTATEETAA